MGMHRTLRQYSPTAWPGKRKGNHAYCSVFDIKREQYRFVCIELSCQVLSSRRICPWYPSGFRGISTPFSGRAMGKRSCLSHHVAREAILKRSLRHAADLQLSTSRMSTAFFSRAGMACIHGDRLARDSQAVPMPPELSCLSRLGPVGS